MNHTDNSQAKMVPSGGGVAVLVVDDNEAVLQSLQMVLRSKGYRVYTALNGVEALRLVLAHPQTIEVVITDFMMPEMDGCETIRALREVDPQLQFIAISGNALPEDVAALYSLGIVDFLAKPFGVGELLKALEKALAYRRAGVNQSRPCGPSC